MIVKNCYTCVSSVFFKALPSSIHDPAEEAFFYCPVYDNYVGADEVGFDCPGWQPGGPEQEVEDEPLF